MRRSPDPDPEQSAASDDATPAVRPFPISLAEFARRAGRAKSTITELFQGPLAAAKLPTGRVDARAPVVTAWLLDRGIDPTALTQPIALVQGTARRDATTTAPPAAPASDAARGPTSSAFPTLGRGGFEDPLNVEDLLDLSLRSIERRFESLTGVSDYVGVRKQIADCRRLELANGEASRTLIRRDFVQTHVIALVANVFRRLLADTPRTLTARVYAAVRAGATLEECEQLVRGLISATLGDLKEAATRALRPRRAKEDAA